MVEKYKYECICGWNTLQIRTPTEFLQNPFNLITKILEKALHPRTKRMWQGLLEHQLISQCKNQANPDLPSFITNKHKSTELPVSYKQNLFICKHCKTFDRMYSFYDKATGNTLHDNLCESCGEEVCAVADSCNIPCPNCDRLIKGEFFSNKLSSNCSENLVEYFKPIYIGIGGSGLSLIEELEDSYYKIGFHYKEYTGNQYYSILIDNKTADVETINEYINQCISNINYNMSETKAIFIVGDIGGAVETSIIRLLVQRLKYYDKNLIAIITKPFSFEGTKAMERATSAIRELQNDCSSFTVIDKDYLLNRETLDINEVNKTSSKALLDLMNTMMNLYQ